MYFASLNETVLAQRNTAKLQSLDDTSLDDTSLDDTSLDDTSLDDTQRAGTSGSINHVKERAVEALLRGGRVEQHAHRLRGTPVLADHLADIVGIDGQLDARVPVPSCKVDANAVRLIDERAREDLDQTGQALRVASHHFAPG